MYSGLSLDQAPPFEAPLRFFLSAPVFGVLLGVFMVVMDADALLTRHTSESVLMIHALMLGVVTMVMIGALQQMLPVLSGAIYPKALLGAKIIHIGFVAGIASFLYGYYFWQPQILFASAVLLLLSLGTFTFVTLYLLLRVQHANATVWAMRLANGMFIVVVLLGSHMLIAHATGNLGEYHFLIAQFHLVAASIGWVLILTIGVAFQVVPMFWVAEAYLPFCRKFILPLAAGTILLYALDLFVFQMIPGTMFAMLLFIVMGSFSTSTLLRLKRRKRKVDDIAVKYWTLGMVSLMGCALVILFRSFVTLDVDNLVFILFGFGFILSLITGMLYKIIPFLAWFHLSSKGIWEVPTIREMIPKSRLEWQWRFYMAGLVLLLVSPIFSMILPLTGSLFILSFVLLFSNLYKAVAIYFKMGKTHVGTSS